MIHLSLFIDISLYSSTTEEKNDKANDGKCTEFPGKKIIVQFCPWTTWKAKEKGEKKWETQTCTHYARSIQAVRPDSFISGDAETGKTEAEREIGEASGRKKKRRALKCIRGLLLFYSDVLRRVIPHNPPSSLHLFLYHRRNASPSPTIEPPPYFWFSPTARGERRDHPSVFYARFVAVKS